MLRNIVLMFAALGLLMPLLSFGSVRPVAAQGGPSVVISNLLLPNSERSKFPDLDVYGPTASVVVSGNANDRDALFWEKGDVAATFPFPAVLGAARGTPDYATAGLTYDQDGTLYYVWGDIPGRSLFLRSRAPGAAEFGPAIFVATSSFPSEAKVATTRLGGVKTIFVFWREGAGEIRYVLSQNEGLPGTWTPPAAIVGRGSLPEMSVFATPDGQVVVGYTLPGGSDGALKAWGAFWNGAGFTPVLISPPSNGSFGEPSFARKSDGTWVAAYRGIEVNANFGAYYTEQQADGSWPILLRDRGLVESNSVVVDPFDNVHLFFTGIPVATGRLDLYYAVRRAGASNFDRVITVPMGADFVSSANAAVNVRGQILIHAATEAFNGGVARYKYALLSMPAPFVAVGGVVLENNLLITRNPEVLATFTGVEGVPTRVRYNWGAPPTDESPTVPFNPAVPNVTIATPLIGEACTPLTLFARLEADGLPPSETVQGNVVIDREVQATVTTTSGAVGYDPDFTNQRAVQLQIESAGDCAGLQQAVVDGDVEGAPLTLPINAVADFAAALTLTDGPGAKTFTIELRDNLGNVAPLITRTITYDPVTPRQTALGTVEITEVPEATILYDVAVNGATANDTGSGLYGVLITTQVTPTAGGAPTTAQVIVPFSAMRSFSSAGGQISFAFTYSLLSGLPASAHVPGTYAVTATLVDRAGNSASTSAFTRALELETLTFPQTYLPLMRR